MKFKVAVRVPLTVGSKVMFAVQLADAARLDPHVLLTILKSLGSVPAMAMLLMVRVLLEVFVRVTAFCAPIPPTGTDAQLREVGLTLAEAVPPVAVPERATV